MHSVLCTDVKVHIFLPAYIGCSCSKHIPHSLTQLCVDNNKHWPSFFRSTPDLPRIGDPTTTMAESEEVQAGGSALPASMAYWTEDHVKRWLLEIGVREAKANEFQTNYVTGLALQLYTEEDLQKDFQLQKDDILSIMKNKDRWLKYCSTVEESSGHIRHCSAETQDLLAVGVSSAARHTSSTSEGSPVCSPKCRPSSYDASDSSAFLTPLEIDTSVRRDTSSLVSPVSGSFNTDVCMTGSSRSFVFIEGHKQVVNKIETKTPSRIIKSDDLMEMESGLPSRMTDWSNDDVRKWLVLCGIREDIAENFFQKPVDGKLMATYTEVDLQSAGLTEMEVQYFVKAKMAWSQKDDATEKHVCHVDRIASRASDSSDDSALELTAKYNIKLENVNDSIVIVQGSVQAIGQPYADVPVTMDITTYPEDTTDKKRADAVVFQCLKILSKMKSTQALREILDEIENTGECNVMEIATGSIRFIVRFFSREGLDRFRERCLKGELAKNLTDILITDEIKQEVGRELVIHMTIEDSDYSEGYRLLQVSDEKVKVQQRPVMADWTTEDVNQWLLQLGLRQSTVRLLKDVDGATLLRLTEEDLHGDFHLKKGEMRIILYYRRERLDGEEFATYEGKAKKGPSLQDPATRPKIPKESRQTTIDPGARPKIPKEPGPKTLGPIAEETLKQPDRQSPIVREEESKWGFCLRKWKSLQRLELKQFSLNGDGLNKVAKSLMQLPKFNQLIVAGNETLSSSAKDWASYLRNMTKLSEIDLSACALTGRDLYTVSFRIRDKSSVRLNLSANGGLGGSTEWVKPFGRIKHMHQLDLSSCKLESRSVADIIGKFVNLVDLNLSSNDLGGSLALWAQSLKPMEKLTKLVLGSCSLGAEDLKHVGLALKDNGSLEELGLSGNPDIGGSATSWSQYLRGLTKLKKLDLSGCFLIGDDLKQYVNDNSPLVELDVSNNEDVGVNSATWSECFRKLKHLEKLYLSGCSLTGESMKHLLDDLNLTELDISANKGLRGTLASWSKKLRGLKNLKGLILMSCSLGNEDVEEVVTTLKDVESFSELILRGNTDIGESLAKPQDPSKSQAHRPTTLGDMVHLTKLDLSDCFLTQGFMKALLKGELKLVEMIISANHRLGGTLDQWVERLAMLKQLENLDLGSCSLTVEDLGFLATALKEIQRFNELCVAGNTALGESRISWYILGRLKQLTKLDLSCCSLKEDGVDLLVERNPNLVEVKMSGNPGLGVALM